MISVMSAISSPVQTVLDLFATSLSDVRFGDVDAEKLAALAVDVQSAAEAVTAAQTLVDDARTKLQEQQDALLLHAQRALAYARVYAESDALLSARIEAIALPRPLRRSRPDANVLLLSSEEPPLRRPRGRPRKTEAPSPELEDRV